MACPVHFHLVSNEFTVWLVLPSLEHGRKGTYRYGNCAAYKLTDTWHNLRARITLNNLMRELSITMLVSMNDVKLVEELFPRAIGMDEGLIVSDGKTKEILQDEKFLNEHGLEKP